MLVLCAPNAFKATLAAPAAAAALVKGVEAAGATALPLPVADGGDGTLEVLLAHEPEGHAEIVVVPGPLGDPVAARLGWLNTTTAVVEMAEAAGLRLLPPTARNPLAASTSGVGEMMLAALDGGARRVIVGVGGSATTDGGIGILVALGAQLRDGDGAPVSPASGGIAWIASVNLEPALRRLQGVQLDVVMDVDNPLLGDRGAARVFAPQKGADARQVEHLESGMTRWSRLVEEALHRPGMSALPGMGAAGGAAFGLAAIGARLHPGAAFVCDAIGINAALEHCDLAITGEGRLDQQTLGGKAPAEVARRAQRQAVRCAAICGEVHDPLPELFSEAIALNGGAGDAKTTARLLTAAATVLVRRAQIASIAPTAWIPDS